MEDLKPPYIFRAALHPLSSVRRVLLHPIGGGGGGGPRETGTIFFFPQHTKTSVSATDVWVGYPRERRFKEVEDWPDASRRHVFVYDV